MSRSGIEKKTQALGSSEFKMAASQEEFGAKDAVLPSVCEGQKSEVMALFTAIMEKINVKADEAEERALELRVAMQESWLVVQRESQQYTDSKVESVKEELLDAIRSLRTEYRGELATLHQTVKEEQESEDGRVEMCDLRTDDRRLSVVCPPVVGAGWQGPPSCSASAGHPPSPPSPHLLAPRGGLWGPATVHPATLSLLAVFN